MNDFRYAVKIYLNNFRFSKYTSRFIKNNYFDEELTEAMDKMNRFPVTVIILLAGIMATCFNGGTIGTGTLIAIWVIVDVVIINPLIYYALIPKPVSDHITPKDRMTEEMKMKDNKRQEEEKARIIEKYDKSGKRRHQ